MGEHEKQMIEDIATIKADVRHLVKVVEEERAERKTDTERITVLEKSRIRDVAYATGFGAGAALLFTMMKDKIFHLLASMLVIVVFAGCAHTGPNGATAWWHDNQRPVDVVIDNTMRPECIELTLQSIKFWEKQGVDYLRVRQVDPFWSGFYGDDGAVGTISVREAVTVPGQLGATRTHYIGKRLRWARIRLSRENPCTLAVTAHELGHALGLKHNPAEDSLMFWHATGSMALDEEEVSWVQ